MGWLMESIAEPLCGDIRGDATLQHTRILGISDLPRLAQVRALPDGYFALLFAKSV
jgi:hypothetical protein